MDTLTPLFDRLAALGGRPALISFTREKMNTLSGMELAGRIDALAAYLRQTLEAGPDTRFALISSDASLAAVAALAVLRSGATLVPLDTQFDDATLDHVLKDSVPTCVLTDARHAERVRRLQSETNLLELPFEAPSSTAPLPALEASHTAVLFYTSGTTGMPKGAPLTQRALAYQIEVVEQVELVHPGERVLLPLPLHHVYPFVVGLLAPLGLGLCMVLPRAMTGKEVLRALREGRANVIIGVPRLYRALLEGIESRARASGHVARYVFHVTTRLGTALRRRRLPSPGRYILAPMHRRLAPRLRLLASGGAALEPELALRLEALGWQVAVGYGLTETAPLLTINPPGSPHPASVGLPVPGTALRVQGGELQARGPGVFAGYHQRPEASAEVFTADGWFRTGDLGRIGADGFAYVTGRASTLIVTEGGKNVQPDEVESAYEAQPAIAEIAVLGESGRLVALVVPSPGDDAEVRVRSAVAEVGRTLPTYQRVTDVAITFEPLARTRLGKLRRHLLPARYHAARAGKIGPAPGPVPVEEMEDADQLLLEDERAAAVWNWLVERYADRRLSPATRLDLELGLDSLGWLDLGLEIAQRTGVELDENRVADIETVRDLLEAVGEIPIGDAVPTSPEVEPRLTSRHRRWLQPLSPGAAFLADALLRLNRLLMRHWFHLGVQMPNRGLPPQCVFTPNHLSYLDPFAVAAALDRRRVRRTFWAGWTGAAFSNPFNRAVSRLAQAIPVDQRDPRTSLALAISTLRRGYSLVWFPEGARSLDGRLRPFKAGLGRLLETQPVPVVPVLIHGSYEALPQHRILPRRRDIRIEFGPPLTPEELERLGQGEARPDRITSGLYRWMSDRLET